MTISLRVVVLLLVTLVGVAATIVSLVPVRDAGLVAVRSTADLLRIEISHRLAGDLLAYFQAPMYGISALIDQYDTGLRNTTGSLMPWVPALSAIANRMQLPVYVANPGDEMCYTTPGTLYYSGYHHLDTATHAFAPSATVGVKNAVVETLYPFNWTQSGFNSNVSDYRPTQRPWFDHVATQQGWGPVYVENGSTTVTTLSPGGPMRNAATGALEGVAVIDVRNDFFLKYFSTVDIAKTGRAMLLHTDSRACLGGNWNESTVVTSAGELRLAKVTEVQEPLFAMTVAALGEDGLFNVSLPYRTSFGSGADIVYIDIVQIADDYGLDLRLVVMIPEKDFLEEVNSQVNVVVGVVVAAVACLLFLAFIITAVLLQPLSTLENRMYAAASFQEDKDGATDNTPSIISEVANIQAAFTTMTAELKRVKSYLPQSLLAKLENTSGGEDEDDEEFEADWEEEANDYKMGLEAAGSIIMGSSKREDTADSTGASENLPPEVVGENIVAERRSSSSPNNKKVDPHDDSGGVGEVGSGGSRLSMRQSWMAGKRNAPEGFGVVKTDPLSRSLQSYEKYHGGAAGRRAAGLLVEDAARFKKVTIVSVNILHSHSRLRSDWHTLQQNQTQLLEAVQLHSKKFKGVIDSFQGDHIVVTFNAVLGVASHQSKGAHFALALTKEFGQGFTNEMDTSVALDAPQQPLTIGLASGDCLVGNMGTEGFKRFNVIGTAYSTAMILERLCKQFKVPILTNQHTANSLMADTFLDALGACELPTANGNRPSVLYNVRAFKEHGHNAEWMYDLQAKEAMDMGVVLNEAWMRFVSEGISMERSPVSSSLSLAPLSVTKKLVANLNDKRLECDEATATGKTSGAGPPAIFSERQRLSLLELDDAVHHKEEAEAALGGTALAVYLERQANRYFTDAQLPQGGGGGTHHY